MSTYNVRLYKESDYGSVTEIYTTGCCEHISAAYYYALRQPRNWLLLLVGLLLPLLTSGGSIALSILGGISVLLLIWLPGREFYKSRVRRGLAGDLKDIRKYYLQREGYCFWVAELEGEVVGIVAASPCITPHEKNVELKRMYISSHHRGKGIGKLLCRTVIDFARMKGYNAVVLSTTSIQNIAIQLYTKMGFRSSDTDEYSALLGLIGISWVGFKYDFSSGR